MSTKQRISIAVLGAMLAGAAGAVHAQYSTPMRNVENPDRFPYQELGSASLPPPFLNGFATFPTPAGKRYIIEHVSVNCSTPSASDTFPQALLTVVKVLSPSSYQSYPVINVPMERRGLAAFGGYVWSGNAQLKAYSDPNPFDSTGGSAISLNIFHTDTSVAASCNAVVSGHTITP
jgi:hypothetical protein